MERGPQTPIADGTLNYSKSMNKRASIMLPLCDISRIERLDIELHGPFCFTVYCPPASILTLRARDNDECQKWMHVLLQHATYWRHRSSTSVTQ